MGILLDALVGESWPIRDFAYALDNAIQEALQLRRTYEFLPGSVTVAYTRKGIRSLFSTRVFRTPS